ncbi:hypothetical protein EVAR_80173_1 [Eumeta japonica]|uniref:Uncharacterized protein n=1 Tax=Eumeta variegata TaxID=151549 RepID=A0A4C1YAC7_EUMVA|nr:hypothetical protein EVAR_80173_1 [Eumeta japonica]
MVPESIVVAGDTAREWRADCAQVNEYRRLSAPFNSGGCLDVFGAHLNIPRGDKGKGCSPVNQVTLSIYPEHP